MTVRNLSTFIAGRTSLENFAVGVLLSQLVGADHQNKGDHGLQKAHGGTEAVLQALQADAVHIGIQNITGGIDRCAVQVIDLVETGVQDVAQIHDGHQDDGGADAGQGDMPDLFPPGGAIDGSSLVKGRVNGSDGCQIDDGAITELFPGVGQDQQGLEQGVAAQPVQRGAQHCVDGAVHAEQILFLPPPQYVH